MLTKNQIELRSRRIEAGITQSRLARYVGLSQSLISHYELSKIPPADSRYKQLIRAITEISEKEMRDLIQKAEKEVVYQWTGKNGSVLVFRIKRREYNKKCTESDPFLEIHTDPDGTVKYAKLIDFHTERFT